MKTPGSAVRIAITGMGIVSSIGANPEEVWESITASRSGIGPLSRFPGEAFPTAIAAETSFDLASASGLSRARSRRMSRTDLLALVAARQAVDQADNAATPLPRERAVVSSGTSTGGLFEGERYYFRRLTRGRRQTPPSSVLQQPTSGPSDVVANVLALGGGVLSNATACASAGAAIGLASDLLQSGHADVAVAGGSDALCRLTYSGFNVLQAVDSDPCRPFDLSRKGITLGEGAAYLVLERWGDAVARGATILAELAGWGATCDAHHPTAPAEDGRGAAAAMRNALAEGSEPAEAVDYVNAHGTGTALNDSAEGLAIFTVLGERTPVSSTKSYFGHTLGASGALEAVVAVLALLHQQAPPTLRLENPEDGGRLDYITGVPRPMRMRTVLSNTFGFGGSNVSLLLRAV